MRLMRFRSKKRAKYSGQVQEYLNKNGLVIVQKICDGILGFEKLEEEKVKDLLGDYYPIAPWIEETDIISQFVCLLEETGYKVVYNIKGEARFKNKDICRAIIQKHMKFNGVGITDRLAYYCEETKGRLNYEQVEEMLGFGYSTAYTGDKRNSIIMFLKATGIPFKFDETHVYFP